jgi:hypothetical protein
MLSKTLALACIGMATSAADVHLTNFDGTYTWTETNDPVMGGQSIGTFTEKGGHAIFNGTCAIVPSLSAPGFTKATTANRFLKKGFPDVSKFIDGAIKLRVRSSTPDYTGYRFAFAAKGIPHTSIFGGGSLKGNFKLTGSDWQVVEIPMNHFSYDWSGFTGGCDTKDPNGQQHHCCTKEHPEVCPKASYLEQITDLEIWAEGEVGSYHLELDWIAAGELSNSTTVCKTSEYCCPDAKACLTPTTTSCAADASACAAGQVCCPLTKICVIPGAACVAPPVCKTSEYCCPDAKHCLTPTAPGKFCKADSCGANQVCCPLTKLCVDVGPACTAP